MWFVKSIAVFFSKGNCKQEWEKIIVKETTDKELISKIYKQVIQLDTRKKKKTQSKSGNKT